MGLASIAAASASAVRAASEFNLYTNENRKRINAENKLGEVRAKEIDAKAKEADDNKSKTVAAFFDKKIADISAEIAELGKISAVLSTVSSLASVGAGAAGAAANGQFNLGSTIFDAVTSIIQGGFSIAGAILAANAAKEEAKMLGKKYGELSEETKQDKKGIELLGVVYG
ncbi:MAG: hypothetical protein KatS3mg068_2458 [Candidatus Sericytochromatia bacterium]|nr:MAG: hypothetical protein KatS3mg068_2458 [Candidatus Sericytochromatia bacterium]